MPVVTGSVKQIAYAASLRGNALSVLFARRDDTDQINAESNPTEAIAAIDAAIAKLATASNARWLIDTLIFADYWCATGLVRRLAER